MKILGIETSCDETAAAVVEDGHKLLSSVVASSLDLHKVYGGVVPEIAARSHLESITPVIEQALNQAKIAWNGIDAIAVTQGPGLIGSLLIGILTARTLAITKNKPLYAVNHVKAHPYGAFITDKKPPALPALCLVVSGGHSLLALLEEHGKYRLLGQTKDDAIGEAFDKVAKMLGLPYPGGPAISQLAEGYTGDFIALPSAALPGGYDFSYSGLKTAVLRASQKLAGKDFTLPSSELAGLLGKAEKIRIAASFQEAALKSAVKQLVKAAQDTQPASVIVAGGVASSSRLRQMLADFSLPCPVFIPTPDLCTDNAGMIASAAYFAKGVSEPADPYKLSPQSSLPF